MKIKKSFIALGMMLAGVALSAGAQTAETVGVEEVYVEESVDTVPVYSISGAEKKLVAERIASWNKSWKSVELNGKIILDGLPVKPSVKIYMESGKKILLSVRVPFIGEAARIEITPEAVIGINKIKKTYYKSDPKSILEADPTIVSELQAIFLGRVALPGGGEFRSSDSDKVEIIPSDADTFMVVPTGKIADGAVNFGYAVSLNGRLQELIGMYSAFDGYLELGYSYSGEKVQIKGGLVGGKKDFGATLQFDEPNWDSKGFSSMKIPSDYRQVGFREVLKLS